MNIVQEALELALSIIAKEEYYGAHKEIDKALFALKSGKFVVVDGERLKELIDAYYKKCEFEDYEIPLRYRDGLAYLQGKDGE